VAQPICRLGARQPGIHAVASTGTPGTLPRTRRQDCFKISGFVGIAGIVEELGLLDRAQLQIENTKTAIY
jgi:hypothetical protein